MRIVFDSLRKIHPVRPTHVFGQGIPTSDHRQPYSVSDLQWAAQHLNASTRHYTVVGQSDASLDARAEESLNQDRVESGFCLC